VPGAARFRKVRASILTSVSDAVIEEGHDTDTNGTSSSTSGTKREQHRRRH